MVIILEGLVASEFVAALASVPTAGNVPSDALAGMFEDRKRLFVDLLDWNVRVHDDRFEIDDFDNADAIYLIAQDDSGAHQGSLRLLPSTRPHLLNSLFHALCPGGVPIGAQIFEITRLCLPQRLGAERRLEIRNQLISAMVDHCRDKGISMLTGVVEDQFRREILAMGWRAEPLGPARRMDGGLLGAFAAHIEGDTASRLSWNGIYRERTQVAA